MIDRQYQKLGFGRTVVGSTIQYVKETYTQAKQLDSM